MNNLDYSIKGANKRRNSGGVKLPYGIHEKLTIKEVTVNDEDQYIDVIFEQPSTLKQINKRIYWPNLEKYKPNPRKGETQEDANQRDVDERIEHLRDFLYLCYSPAEVEELEPKSFAELCHKTKQMLDAKKDQFFVNLKVIPTSDLQYSELPRYAGGYIELWREGLKPTLKFNNWELEERINPLTEPAPATDEPVAPGLNLFNVS